MKSIEDGEGESVTGLDLPTSTLAIIVAGCGAFLLYRRRARAQRRMARAVAESSDFGPAEDALEAQHSFPTSFKEYQVPMLTTARGAAPLRKRAQVTDVEDEQPGGGGDGDLIVARRPVHLQRGK